MSTLVLFSLGKYKKFRHQDPITWLSENTQDDKYYCILSNKKCENDQYMGISVEYKGNIIWEKVRKENETSDIQLEESRIDRWVKIGIAGAELLVPLTFYGIWLWTGFKFEETGTYVSPTFKHLIKFFKPKK